MHHATILLERQQPGAHVLSTAVNHLVLQSCQQHAAQAQLLNMH